MEAGSIIVHQRHVRQQLARLFREAKTGKVDPNVSTKLAYLLNSIRQTIEVGGLETEISDLRREVASRAPR